MPKVLKIIVVGMITLMTLGVAGVLALRDLDRRPDYCALCHVTEQGVASWVNSDYLAYKHAVAGISCQRCHERSVPILLREIWSTTVKGTYAPPERLQFPSDDCGRCHGDSARLAEYTKTLRLNPHQSPHGNQECRECHRVHEPSVDSCAECHEPTIVGPGWTTPTKPVASR